MWWPETGSNRRRRPFRAGLAYDPTLLEATGNRQIEEGSFSNEITHAPKGYLNACES
jgi:hypothetical protein